MGQKIKTPNRIREHRTRRGLSQAELADAANLQQSAIALLEKGRQDLKVHHLKPLAKALGVRTIDILPADMVDPDLRHTDLHDIEAEQYDPADMGADLPRNYADFAQMMLRDNPHRSAWIYQSKALEYEGYRKGDIFILDEDVAPQIGDIVCAQIYGNTDAETVFRIFQDPYLIAATHDAKLSTPIMIDRFRTRVVGTVTEVLRQRAHQ